MKGRWGRGWLHHPHIFSIIQPPAHTKSPYAFLIFIEDAARNIKEACCFTICGHNEMSSNLTMLTEEQYVVSLLLSGLVNLKCKSTGDGYTVMTSKWNHWNPLLESRGLTLNDMEQASFAKVNQS